MISGNALDWKKAVVDSVEEFAKTFYETSQITPETKEPKLQKELMKNLQWSNDSFPPNKGMFGWNEFRTDHKITKINGNNLNPPFILELKKARKKTEYVYWEGLAQSLIYRYLMGGHKGQKSDLPVLCLVLDWGRASNRFLCDYEIDFPCELCKGKDIFFLRIAFG